MKNKYDLMIFAENFGKSIGNTTRFKILSFLTEGPHTVSEITKRLNMSQSTTSQHLLVLKNCQLIYKEKRGQYVYYAVNFDYVIKGLKGLTAVLESKAEGSCDNKQHLREPKSR